MSYIYKVFEHLEQLWMGIWQPTYNVTTTEVSPDLGEFTEILDDVCVDIKVFEHLEQLWMGIWQHTHTVTTTEVSPVLGEIIDNVSVGMIPLRYR